MASLNKVFLIGNLTRDPEIRYTPGGSAICAVGLATNRRYTTSKGEERDETCFVDIDVWGKQAESCHAYLKKGAPVFVEGRLKFDQWDDRETGRKRSRLLVTAERVQFLSQPQKSSEYEHGPHEYSESSENSNYPNQASPNKRSEPPPFPADDNDNRDINSPKDDREKNLDESIDDIPF